MKVLFSIWWFTCVFWNWTSSSLSKHRLSAASVWWRKANTISDGESCCIYIFFFFCSAGNILLQSSKTDACFKKQSNSSITHVLSRGPSCFRLQPYRPVQPEGAESLLLEKAGEVGALQGDRGKKLVHGATRAAFLFGAIKWNDGLGYPTGIFTAALSREGTDQLQLALLPL